MKAETAISKQIRAALATTGWHCIRINCGAVRVKGGYMHGAPEGTPDLLTIGPSGGLVGFLEVKQPGEKREPAQLEFARQMQRRGVPCARVESAREAVETVAEWRRCAEWKEVLGA